MPCAGQNQDDICLPFGSSTFNHSQCWVGINDEAFNPSIDLGGCDHGCVHCSDIPDDLIDSAADVTGSRWLRFRSDDPRRSEHADGMIRDMKANEPYLLPVRGFDYEVAACFDSFGVECFEDTGNSPYHVCRCWPHFSEEFDTDTQLCQGDIPRGGRLRGLIPHQFVYKGSELPATTGMYCRRFADPPVRIDSIGPGAMRNLGEVRLDTNCVSNILIGCMGTVQSSQCDGAYGGRNASPSRVGWPNVGDPGCRDYWFHPAIVSNSARLRLPPATHPARATVELKNRVLAYVASEPLETPIVPGTPRVRFDELDSSFQDNNIPSLVSHWLRSWTPDPQALESPIFLPQPVGALGEVRTRRGSKIASAALFVIESVRYEMGFVATHLRDSSQDNIDVDLREEWIESHATFRIEVGCRAVITALRPEVIQGPGIVPYTIADGPLLFLDGEGRKIAPPLKIVWEGLLGFNGLAGVVRKRLETPPPEGDFLRFRCKEAARAISPIQIHGWPTRLTSLPESPSAHYDGLITLTFRTPRLDDCQ